MRTQTEILERTRKEKNEPMNFAFDVLVWYLDFEHVKEFLQSDATPGGYSESQDPLDKDFIVAAMRKYMEFAWGKVHDRRGISASRSVIKFKQWVWLLAEDDQIDWTWDQADYGAAILKRICTRYNFPVPA